MNKSILSLLIFFFVLTVNAQELKVKNFQQVVSDLSARTNVKKDLNDQPCALVKVQIAAEGVSFRGSIIGEPEMKINQYWVYMPAGTKKLQINHKNFIPLDVYFNDYGIVKLESLCTYIMTIVIPNADDDKIRIKCNAKDASIYILDNDKEEYIGDVSSAYKLSNGKHRIKLVADGYYDYEGNIMVTKDIRTYDINMTAKAQVEIKKVSVGNTVISMVLVQGGKYFMGATTEQEYSDINEKPVHEVVLRDFYIGETEVTQELWKSVMDGNNPSKFIGDDNKPVEQVSWEDCQLFIKRLNDKTGMSFRLPTEAEWEYASRGGVYSFSNKYAGSNTLKDVAWEGTTSFNSTHTVKTKQPNELGLYDMSGNVCEWCQDIYSAYSSESQTDPHGPVSGAYHVFRGGSWNSYPRSCRVSSRDFNKSTYKAFNIGLRLAL